MSNKPTAGRLLAGVVDTLQSVVLPELARGSAARRQLNAAIDILRRLAFAAPRAGVSLDADNADIAATLRAAAAVLQAEAAGRLEAALRAAEASGDREARNAALQAALGTLQEDLAGSPDEAVSSLLRALYRRIIDREIALIPPSRYAAKDSAA